MRSKHLRSWAWLVWLLVPVLLAGCGRRGGDDRDNSAPDRSISGGPSDGADGPGLGDLPVPDIQVTDGGTDGTTGDQESSSGGAEEPEPEPTDTTEEAFRAVVQGTCLPIYRDGNGWNVSVPPDAVSCRSDRAGLFEVTRTTTGSATCPSDVGEDEWSYDSSVTGNTTTLCLDRVWVQNYCVLAEQSGDTISSIGSSTAVDCEATKVPSPYNQVLVVAAVYQAPAGADASNCRTGSQDTLRYWSLLTDNGNILVCFRARS